MLQNKTTFKFSLRANPVNNEMQGILHIGLALNESSNVLFCIRNKQNAYNPSDEPARYTNVIYLRTD